MQVKRHLLLRIIAPLSLFLLVTCGLPEIGDISSQTLDKPTLSIYNDTENLYITVTGVYPESNYPDFEGFNIYVGDNNEVAEILKRVLYIDKTYELPSLERDPNDGSILTASVTLNKKFDYRFTQKATEDDLTLAKVTDITLLKGRAWRNYEKFDFIVRPIQLGLEGPSSDTYTYTIINYKTNQSVTWNNTLDQADDFSPLIFSNNSGNYSLILETNMQIYSVGLQNDIFTHNSFPSAGYGSVTHTPEISNLYYLKSTSTTPQYLKLYIENLDSTEITFSFGHLNNITTDFNN